jgi:dihydroorotate dehydrogenase (NAD+) catalytic subunit
MIELAPGHKVGFSVASPVVVGAGVIGYGEVAPAGLELGMAGAAVVGPVTMQSRSGAASTRLAETVGGIVMNTGLQNRGLNAVLNKFSKLWARLGCPIVVQVAEQNPRQFVDMLERLAGVEGVGCIELLPLTQDAALAAQMVRAGDRASDLPIWVKVPPGRAVAWSQAVADVGAAGIVVGQPPPGALVRDGAAVMGAIYGPMVFPQMLERLFAVAKLGLGPALIASGGIHTVDQAKQALEVGAAAVQVDTACWVEPGTVGTLVGGLAGG